MRITRARALVLVAIVASAAALVAATSRRATKAPPPGPVLVVRALGIDGGTAPARAGDEGRAMALAGASLSPADRARILEQLDVTTARLEARLSPLGTDLEDDDPVDGLRRALQRHMPTFTAARELERGAWASADLSVRVAASCSEATAAAGETCLSLWDANDGPPDLGRRARFLAWAASRAVVIDLGSPARVAECARVLRERTSVPTSTLALVLTDDDLALRPAPDRAALQAGVRRLGAVMSASGRHDTADLEPFASAIAEERAAPWLVLAPTALVVVPRLSAMSDSAGITREIEDAAGPSVRWLHRP